MKAKTRKPDLDGLRKVLTEALGPRAEDARIIADMPLTTGQVRLTVTTGGTRTTAWGPTMPQALDALIEKIVSAHRAALSKSGDESPLLPL